jgi:glucose-1-phosphate thymidylyltransferase
VTNSRIMFLAIRLQLVHTTKYYLPMKGIVLAGGSGSRLWPITRGISKQLLPIYDKPLIHYPIATLMLAGIREILIITTPEDQSSFVRLLGDGSEIGIKLKYAIQSRPEGLAQAFIVGEDFIGKENVALILGDNIFHGSGLGTQLETYQNLNGAQIFAYKVTDPSKYGIVEFEKDGKVASIEEKPEKPKSTYAIPGLYFYDTDVVAMAKKVLPSSRGELEITSINQEYLKSKKLSTKILERGTVWLDTGTKESLFAAASYVRVIEERQGQKIACLEEIAWQQSWISDKELKLLASKYSGAPYGAYLFNLLN